MACPCGSPCLPGSRIDIKKPPEHSRDCGGNSLSLACNLTHFLLEIQVDKFRWASPCPSSFLVLQEFPRQKAKQPLIVTGKVATPSIVKEIPEKQWELITAFLSPFPIKTMANLLPHNHKVTSHFRADRRIVVAAISFCGFFKT